MATHHETQLKFWVKLDEYIPHAFDSNDDGSVATPLAVVASYDQAKNIPQLNACFKEVICLRLIVGMGLPRIVPPGQTFTFKGETFKEGSVNSVPNMTINYMDIRGPETKTFRPEQWLEPRAVEFKKY